MDKYVHEQQGQCPTSPTNYLLSHGALVARYTIRVSASSGQSKIPNINTLREDLDIIRHLNNKLKHKLKMNEIKMVDEQWTNLTKSLKYAVNKSIP